MPSIMSTDDAERRELDRLISLMTVAEHRVRRLHEPEGWGEKMRCRLCNCHGDKTWPCMTIKALEFWRWNAEGKPISEPS